MTLEKAKQEYLKRLQLDERKARAALDAFWAFVVVSYEEKHITLDRLIDIIDAALKDRPEGKQEKLESKFKIQSRPFQKRKRKHKWPTRKIPSRKFN